MMDVSQIVWRQLRRVYRQERVSMDDHVGARELENNRLGFWGGNHFFEVGTFLPGFHRWTAVWEGMGGQCLPSTYWSEMIFNMQRGGMISNMRDKEGVRSQCIVVERELALATLATHRWRNCKTVALFPQTIAEQSNNCTPLCFLPEMRPGPRRKAGLPGVQSDDFPESGEKRSSPQGGARTGKPSLSSKNRILVHFNDGIFIFLELILMIKI